MKISTVPTLIAIAICVLLAYALYAICRAEEQQLLLAIGGFVCLSLTMATALGVRFKQSRTSANIAVLGWTFFCLLLVSHAIFAFVRFATPAYVIVNGILLLAFLGTTYAIAAAKQ